MDADNVANGVTVSVLPRSKFFSTDAPAEALRGGGFDQKRANRAPSDSHLRALARRRAHIASVWREGCASSFECARENFSPHRRAYAAPRVHCIKGRACS